MNHSSQSPNHIQLLKKRAKALQALRQFFEDKQVWEVDTPILSRASVVDVHLDALSTQVMLPSIGQNQTYYLHTSPEYPMKRLLCEGSGDIYFLGKVFRNGDLSQRHQPEFTMLEWYRLNFSLQQMINETLEVIQLILGKQPIQQLTYQQAFADYADIENIHLATAEDCLACLRSHGVPEVIGVDASDKTLWEQLVLTEVIESQLGKEGLSCLTHFPAKDAALAQISADNSLTAERFEIFYQGMELANGYLELQDAQAYRQRFEAHLQTRKEMGKKNVPFDEALVESLEKQGLPNCSGVALGFDRVFLKSVQLDNLADVLSFGILDS